MAFAGSQGNFQLNVYKPVILHNVMVSVGILADACDSFNVRCVQGIGPNMARIEHNLNDSLMLATALAPHLGYERTAEIALAADREGTGLREAALRLGFVTGEQFDAWVRPAEMTRAFQSRD